MNVGQKNKMIREQKRLLQKNTATGGLHLADCNRMEKKLQQSIETLDKI